MVTRFALAYIHSWHKSFLTLTPFLSFGVPVHYRFATGFANNAVNHIETYQLVLCLQGYFFLVMMHLNLPSLLRSGKNWHFALLPSLFCMLVLKMYLNEVAWLVVLVQPLSLCLMMSWQWCCMRHWPGPNIWWLRFACCVLEHSPHCMFQWVKGNVLVLLRVLSWNWLWQGGFSDLGVSYRQPKVDSWILGEWNGVFPGAPSYSWLFVWGCCSQGGMRSPRWTSFLVFESDQVGWMKSCLLALLAFNTAISRRSIG